MQAVLAEFVTLLGFGLFASAAWWHFKGKSAPAMHLVAALSLLAFLLTEYELFAPPVTHDTLPIGLALQIASIGLFFAAIRASRGAGFGVAFGGEDSDRICTQGPYRYVRHPFYTSYMMFWIGCLLISPTMVLVGAVVAITAMYFLAASREESYLLSTPAGAVYSEYQSRTGRFLPRLPVSIPGRVGRGS